MAVCISDYLRLVCHILHAVPVASREQVNVLFHELRLIVGYMNS